MGVGEGSTTVVLALADGAVVARWRLGEATPVDLELVDDLARVALAARRRGWSLALADPCPALVDLVRLAGLTEVLPTVARDDPAGPAATAPGARRGRRSPRGDRPPA